MTAITAIVFDANVFGKNVLPKTDLVQQWADACSEHDAELWISEVVVWELAQRMLAAHAAAVETAEGHNHRLRKAGLPETPVPAAISEIDVCEALESAGAVIVDTDPDAAVVAIRDQVLLRGPGNRKEDVKTGAADSAWIRSVLDCNGGDAEGLVVVTGDRKAVLSTCADVGVDPPQIARDVHQLRQSLGPTSEASPDQVALFGSVVSDTFGPASSPDYTELADVDPRYNWWSVSEVETWEHQESYIDGHEPEIKSVTFDPWSSSLIGRVRLPLSVEEVYSRQDDWGDAPEYLHQTYEAWIEGDLTVFVPITLAEEDEPSAVAVSDFEDVEIGTEAGSENLERRL